MLFKNEYKLKSKCHFDKFRLPLKQKGMNTNFQKYAAFIYQCKPHPQEIYKIHKIWAKPFPVQKGVIHWEDKNEIYYIS